MALHKEGVIQMKHILSLFLKKKIVWGLHFLDKYSNGLMVIFACLTTVATFFLWNVAHKQTELMSIQTELTSKQAERLSIMEKASVRPIIKVNYINETHLDYTRRNNIYPVAGAYNMKIRTFRLTNTGRGSACKLKIEFYGEKTKESKEWELAIEKRERGLAVGETREYVIRREDIKSGGFSSFVKVTYQDILGNEYITDIFGD